MDVENPSVIRAKGSRAKTRKVRTGCITCKKRHVKCDEAKPSCSNCLKSRGHCEGYAIEPRKHLSIRRAIQARPDQNPQPDTDWPLTSMMLDPVHHDFPDPLSLFYFREFISLLQDPWMTGLSNSQGCLWRETLPQVCRTNHTLRNAAMAVGAMGMFRKETNLHELDTSTQSHIADPRYLQALAYYGKALQLQSQRASFQSSAFLSLILLIFESLRLRKTAALDHTNHGMALLLSFLGDRTTSSDEIANFSPNPRPILGQLADIFMHLATQTRVVLKGRIGQHCPLPDLAKGLQERGISMEDFIVLLSEVSTSKHCITPQRFNSLDEFEEDWISMTRRQAEMGPIMLQAMTRSTILECEHQQQISDLFASTLKDSEVQKFCDDARRDMDSMEQAFLPLFSDIMMSTTMDSPTYLRALYLRLRFLSVQVFSNPPQYACIESMVTLTPRLREFLSLAELAIRITRKTAVCRTYSLCIDGGLAWYLLQIALHCRDSLLRDEAILALDGYAGQDGLWTTRSLHALALRNRIVEQQNANGDTAQVQWQRLWRREYYLEDGGERVVFRFLEKERELDQWILVEEVGEFQDKGMCAKWIRQPNPQSGRLLVQEGFPQVSAKGPTGRTPRSKGFMN